MPKSAAQLSKAVLEAEKAMKPFRASRTEAISRILGRHYGANADQKRRYNNLLLDMIRLHQARLVPAVIQPRIRHVLDIEDNGDATMIAQILKQLSEEIDLIGTLSTVVMEAGLSPFGVMRCGIAAGHDVARSDRSTLSVGQFFALPVLGSDYFIDPTARSVEEATLEGDWCWLDQEAAYESGAYDPDALDRLFKLSDHIDQEPRLSTGASSQDEPYRDKLMVCECAMRYPDGTWYVATLGGTPERPGSEFLREPQPFAGPEGGPYAKLCFDRVPGELFGLSPAAQVMDIDEALNDIVSHTVVSAKESKRNYIYDPSESDMVMRLRDAKPFGAIAGDPKAGVATVDTGGIMPDLIRGAEFARAIANNATGMQQLMSGQRSSAETATESLALQAGAQQQIASMQAKVEKLIGDVFGHMAFHAFNDPNVSLPMVIRMPGTESAVVNYPVGAREMDWFQWRYDVEPLPRLPMDANSQLARLTQALQMFTPIMQFGMQVGIPPQSISEFFATTFGAPDIRRLVPTMPQQAALQAYQQGLPPIPQRQPNPAQGQPINQVRADAVTPQPASTGVY